MIIDDPTIYLADFGVDVVAGTATGRGILDMPSDVIIDGQVISTDYTLLCEASKFGNLLYGSQITVNGAAYQVLSVMMITDGMFVQLSLQRSTETPYTTASTPIDGNGADASIDTLSQVQLSPDIDGGGPDATYIEGNTYDGGEP